MKNKLLGYVKNHLYQIAPALLVVLLGVAGWFGHPATLTWFLAHLGAVSWILCFVFLRLGWALVNTRRKQALRETKSTQYVPKSLLPPFKQSWRDWFDLFFLVDTKKRRIFNLVFTVLIAAIVIFMPVGRSAKDAPPLTDIANISQGWEVELDSLALLLIPVFAPLIWLSVVALRSHAVTKQRVTNIELIYNMAANILKYPRKARNIRREEMAFQSANSAIQVKKWAGITKPEVFWVSAPVTLDVEDQESWNKLQSNLDKRLPAENGWHFEFDPQGRGVTVMPSQYPLSIIWDGEQHPDPLTFYVGADLDSPGELLEFRFSDTSPHSATVGGTGSGKQTKASDYLAGIKNGVVGFYRNYEYNIGDYLFDPETGMPTRITAFSDWMQAQVYRVHLSDGSYKDVSGDHRWTTWDRAARRSEGRGKTERAREGWLSADQIAVLTAEAENPSDDHISLKELATLAGLNQPNKAMYDLAKAVGVSKEQTILKECHYSAQTFEQRQKVVVFNDRQETLNSLLTYYEATANRKVLAKKREQIKALATVGASDITSSELKEGFRTDWSNVSRSLVRAGVAPGVREARMVKVTVPEKTVMKEHGVVNYYPRRDMCLALAQMGAEPWHDQRHLRSMPKVRTTSEILETLHVGEYTNHSLKVTAPVRFPERDLPCHPYVFGAWVGDGATNAVKARTTIWATEDSELFDEVRALEPSLSFTHYRDKPSGNSADHHVVGLRDILPEHAVRRDDAWAKSGLRKQIPEEYLMASVEQRWALLQGLMDTDGSVNKTGNCEFYQSDRELAEQVRSLVLSLGMVASLREKDAGYVNDAGERVTCRVAWTVAFTPPAGVQVFRLARKQERLDASADLRSDPLLSHRFIVDVEVLDTVERMRCIAVDAPSHQFLLGDDFVPTHNTSVTEAIVAQAATKPMPWSDPEDPIYAQIYIVDPKGPFANRWENRPNCHVVNGTRDKKNADGDDISGIEAMEEMVSHFSDEMNRRGKIIDDAGLAKWLDFSDEEKRKLRLAPAFICLDEYLDHTDKLTSKSEQGERDNTARQVLTEQVLLIARKGRSYGFHIMLIAQMANMTAIGSALMRQLIARIIMGNMDASAYQSFFGTTEVPLLPTQRSNGKGIPGRGRLMNAPGQKIHRLQAFWFGGDENSETLDKHLPKSSAGGRRSGEEEEPYMGEEPDELEEVEVEESTPAPEPPPAAEKPKAKPKKTPPKPKKTDVADASELFGKKADSAPEPDEEDEGLEECVVDGHRSSTVRACDNPKCSNKVCAAHKQSPDGVMWVCPDCAKKHILTRMKLGSFYPWAKKAAESKGGSVTWAKSSSGVEVLVRMDGVELVKVTSDGKEVEALNGQATVQGVTAARKMVTESLS